MTGERAQSFGSVAEQYDEFRPGPPPEAASLLGDLNGVSVLEVAAGTGLWSRFLLGQGASLTVVEPNEQMRAVLERRSPGVPALVGTAESLPVKDASFDVVVSSSAWHWFRQPDATLEMARVLKDDGRIFVFWNGFARDVEWVQELTRLRDDEGDTKPRPRGWTATELADGPFHDVTDVAVDWTWPRTPAQIVALFGTYSGVIVRSETERSLIDAKVRARLADVADGAEIDLPMTLRGTTARRSAR
ncbi:MAG: class I SAM-dependent methyltransferase [Acidimicrobiales bacterium]